MEQVALALTFASIVGLFSVYVDVNEAVRSYQDSDIELWGITSELEGNMVPFKIGYRVFGSFRDIRSIVRTLHATSTETDKKLARFLKAPSSNTVDLEAQTTNLPMFSRKLARLKWSLGAKWGITVGVGILFKQVDMLYRHIQCCSPIPRSHPSFPLDDESIWLTDDRSTSRQLHLWLYKPVGGFVLCLMQGVKDGLGSLDQATKARILRGEFMIVPEDESNPHSIYRHNAQPVILAENWEENALPGRKFRMVMRSEGDTDTPSQAIEWETLHRTWDIIKPFLDDILKLSGWEQ